MRFERLVTVGALATALSAAAADPHPASVPAPDIRVGDTWTYDSIDGYKEVREFSLESRATEVSADRITLEWKRTDGRATGAWIVNRHLNWIERRSSAGVNTADPYYPNLSFPLSVGKTWSQKVRFVAKYEQEKTIEADLDGKVVGWEQVAVPAGTFEALKIEISGPYKGSSGNFNWKGYLREFVWYAPEAKRPVRTRYEDSASGHGFFRDWQDLAAFKVE